MALRARRQERGHDDGPRAGPLQRAGGVSSPFTGDVYHNVFFTKIRQGRVCGPRPITKADLGS